VSERNLAGLSPLHVAAKHGHSNVADILVSNMSGANVDMVTSIGARTALHIAASEGATRVTQLLLTSGASPSARATSEWTPLHFAAREGHTEICRMIVTKGGNKNAMTTGGWTPMMMAAAFNRLEVAAFLLSVGADPRKTNSDGASAEVIAAGKGFIQMTEILRGSSSSTPTASPSAPPPSRQESHNNNINVDHSLNSEQLPPIAISEDSDVVDGDEEDSNDDISAMIEYMRQRETVQLDELKQELETNKQILGVTERKYNEDIESHNKNLSHIQQQLVEAQKLEENMKKDLKRISKDIDVLQRQDLDVRNEISTQNKRFLHSKSVQEKKVEESQEKLHQFVSNMKMKVKDRIKSPENKMKKAPSMYDGLNMESELECPICFELSRPPVYQCPEGHIICHKCRPRVSRCPVCRFVFKGPDIRNRFIEKMSDYYFSMEL